MTLRPRGAVPARPRTARRVTRSSLVTCIALALAGCGRDSVPSRTAASEHGVDRSVELALLAADAEVWAFSTHVHGTGPQGAQLRACEIVVQGAARPARIRGARFSAEVALTEGENVLHARCQSSRGVLRSKRVRFVVPLSAAPVARARATLTERGLQLDATASEPSEHSRAALASYTWHRAGPLGAEAGAQLASGARATLALDEARRSPIVELRVTDEHARVDTTRIDATALLEGAEPAWLRQSVVYGVFPPLYGEPPLRSVTARLPALAELGVTALWLSPIFEAAQGDYGYAVRDYFAVRRDFGTEQDLAQLVARAHALGLRVLLDFVPNHTSIEHRYFAQARSLGRRSHYYDFYDRDAHGEPTHYFDWKHLPNLEYANPEVERFMLAASAHWLRRFAIDGYRVDAAWGVVTRDPDFFPRWVAELERARPDALLIAEASARDPYYAQHGFDAAYDWTDELGHWAWRDVFSREPGIARRLHEAVMESAKHSPPEQVLRFLNNNDTGIRFITRHGVALTKVATAALLTLPGIPCLFSFDEVGAEYEPYQVEEPLAVRDDPQLRAFHARWIALRKAHPALHGAGFFPLHVGARDELYVFIRSSTRPSRAAETSHGAALVVLNFGEDAASARIEVPEALAPGGFATLRDALDSRVLRVEGGRATVQAPAFSAHVLVP